MTGGTAAHRYAKALFSLAEDDHRHREVRTELEGLGSLFDGSREKVGPLLQGYYIVPFRVSIKLGLLQNQHQSCFQYLDKQWLHAASNRWDHRS